MKGGQARIEETILEGPNPRIYPYLENLCKLGTNNYEMIHIDTNIFYLMYIGNNQNFGKSLIFSANYSP